MPGASERTIAKLIARIMWMMQIADDDVRFYDEHCIVTPNTRRQRQPQPDERDDDNDGQPDGFSAPGFDAVGPAPQPDNDMQQQVANLTTENGNLRERLGNLEEAARRPTTERESAEENARHSSLRLMAERDGALENARNAHNIANVKEAENKGLRAYRDQVDPKIVALMTARTQAVGTLPNVGALAVDAVDGSGVDMAE
jgi:hypothetical protein